MSVFNLNTQNENLDNKIVAGLERLTQAFRTLLWDKAKEYGLSPIQIQILIFLRYHSHDKATVSYLAKEFNLTKPTISDAIKALEQKKLIEKLSDNSDNRSYSIILTEPGIAIVTHTEDFINPVSHIVSAIDPGQKESVWKAISTLIITLNKAGVISTQRTCPNCKYFSPTNKAPYCSLLNKKLEPSDIRIDCFEFEHI